MQKGYNIKMSYQHEFIMLKPGIKTRRIVGQIIQRFEQKGLDLKAIKLLTPAKLQLERLYQEHRGKEFYASLIKYMSSEVLVMVWGGESAVRVARTLIGATNPLEAAPGTIRGDFALSMPENVVHASDSEKSAQREIKIFFKKTELEQLL